MTIGGSSFYNESLSSSRVKASQLRRSGLPPCGRQSWSGRGLAWVPTLITEYSLIHPPSISIPVAGRGFRCRSPADRQCRCLRDGRHRRPGLSAIPPHGRPALIASAREDRGTLPAYLYLSTRIVHHDAKTPACANMRVVSMTALFACFFLAPPSPGALPYMRICASAQEDPPSGLVSLWIA